MFASLAQTADWGAADNLGIGGEHSFICRREIDRAWRVEAFMEMSPETGRLHQLVMVFRLVEDQWYGGISEYIVSAADVPWNTDPDRVVGHIYREICTGIIMGVLDD